MTDSPRRGRHRPRRESAPVKFAQQADGNKPVGLGTEEFSWPEEDAAPEQDGAKEDGTGSRPRTSPDEAARLLQKTVRKRKPPAPPPGKRKSSISATDKNGEARGDKSMRMMVGVRVRPLASKEAKKGSESVIEVVDGSKVFARDPDDKMGGIDYLRLDKNKDKAYQFDAAFGPECSSGDVYEQTVRRVVDAVLSGFHGACFAYGATGSGKTFTMMGTAEAPGVMPRAVGDLFDMAAEDDDNDWRFAITYVEIYNERVKDLLSPSSKVDLEVREDAKKGTHIQGAAEVWVSSLKELMEHMNRGSLYRTTEATNCNEVSSRSHAVLQASTSGVYN
eukprot:6204967-Pleurochrysis_carterae.AAC.2